MDIMRISKVIKIKTRKENMAFGLARKACIRKTLIVACCAAIVAVLTLGLVKIIKKGVSATTADGGAVILSIGPVITYGSSNPPVSTYKYSIVTANGGQNFEAFCGNPGTPYPEPSQEHAASILPIDNGNNKQILLAVYTYAHRNSSNEARELIRQMFGDLTDEELYGWVYSVVASYYTGDNNLNGNASDIARLEAAKAVLETAISSTGSPVLTSALQNNLYSISQPERQTIFWIEPKPLGSIVVTKKDTATGTTPQGNASFNGIKFIAKQGQATKGSCTLAGDSATCTIEDLEYGEYTVWEANGVNGQATHPSYEINVETSKPARIISSTPVEVEFENEVRKGNVTVRKKDAKMQDGECRTTSGRSFNGITFSIYLSSGNKNPIIYNGRTVSEDQLVDSKSIGSTGCEVRFDDLPYGKYYIKETKANDDYILNGEVKYVDVPSANQWQAIEVEFSNEPTSIGTVAVDGKDGDHYVEASSKATIKDTIQYCVTPNKKYTIKGVLMNKETGEKLLVDGKPVESSVDINPKTSCGSVVMNFELDASALGGKEAVVFERLYEYKSDGDYDGEDPIVKHEDIDDPKQTIDIISLATVAQDGADGDKTVLADKAAVIKDSVDYCVKPGQKYVIRGVLMNKATGEPLLVNGNKIEGAIEIEPTEACGTAEMLFHFDAAGLQGTQVVVFEKLYAFEADEDEDEPIITHEDINDEAQAVIIYLPTPNTGRFTASDSDGQVGGSILAPVSVVIVVGGYGIYRGFAKRRFFGRK